MGITKTNEELELDQTQRRLKGGLRDLVKGTYEGLKGSYNQDSHYRHQIRKAKLRLKSAREKLTAEEIKARAEFLEEKLDSHDYDQVPLLGLPLLADGIALTIYNFKSMYDATTEEQVEEGIKIAQEELLDISKDYENFYSQLPLVHRVIIQLFNNPQDKYFYKNLQT